MAMKACKECGTEISSGAKVCPKLGTTYIEGEIKNNTDKTYTYVQVTLNYKAIGLASEDVASYKLVEITRW